MLTATPPLGRSPSAEEEPEAPRRDRGPPLAPRRSARRRARGARARRGGRARSGRSRYGTSSRGSHPAARVWISCASRQHMRSAIGLGEDLGKRRQVAAEARAPARRRAAARARARAANPRAPSAGARAPTTACDARRLAATLGGRRRSTRSARPSPPSGSGLRAGTARAARPTKPCSVCADLEETARERVGVLAVRSDRTGARSACSCRPRPRPTTRRRPWCRAPSRGRCRPRRSGVRRGRRARSPGPR